MRRPRRGSRARRRLAGDRAQQPRRRRSAARRSPPAWRSWAPAGRWSRAAWSHGRAGRSSRFGVLLAGRGLCLVRGRVRQPGRGLAGPVHRRAADLGARARRSWRMRRSPTRAAGSRRRAERAVLALAYASTMVVLGLLPALRLRPRRAGLLAVSRATSWRDERARARRALERAGLRARPGLGAGARRARRSGGSSRSTSAARLLAAPVLLAAVAYLGTRRRRLCAQPRARVPLQRHRRPAALARPGGRAR